jgi:hypothetical protein
MPLSIYTADTAPSYCVLEDVKSAAERWNPLTPAEETRANASIVQASRWVDQQTGKFFYARKLAVTTEAPGDRLQRLYVPASVIELTAVEEDGEELDLDNVLIYPGALEKRNTFQSAGSFVPAAFAQYWSTSQQGIVVSGTFGYATCPADIVRLTAHVAGNLLGWIVRSYDNGSGVMQSVRDDKTLPMWAKMILDSYRSTAMDQQSFMVKDVA